MGKKSAETVRVFVVDDHAVVREGLRTFFGMLDGIELAGEAANGEEALQKIGKAAPHVVLMDLMMPGMGGIEATRRLHETHPEIKVIALTSFSGDDAIFPAIKAGVSAYLLKDAGPRELEDAVRAAARGEVRLHPDVTRRLMTGLAGGADKAPEEELTSREKEVLGCLGRGMSNKEIAGELFISEKTVKTHVSAVLAKLDLSDRTQAALYAARRGLAEKPR
jgi:NarL family two-component system response regulator LiaR